jgi:hypothetical protein
VSKRGVGIVLALLCAPSFARAGAWTLPEGTGQLLAIFTASTSTTDLEGSRGSMPTARYNKDEISALIEYGVTGRLTAIIDPGLQHIDIGAPSSAERAGLGYTEFGARYAFLQVPNWVVSGQATLRIPGTTDTANPAAVGYTYVQADFRALLGHNFAIADRPAFFDVEVAERAGISGPSEVHVDGTFGVKIFPRWMLLAQSFNVFSQGGVPALYGGTYQYYKLQLSALYELTPTWSVQGGGFSTYAGRNALQENGVLLGVWHGF